MAIGLPKWKLIPQVSLLDNAVQKDPVVFVYNPGYAQRDQKENKSLLLNMPSTQCCVPGCLNRGGHTIPRDISQRKKWLYAIRRQETAVSKVDNMWEPKSKSAVVCYQHFTPEDYINLTVHGR